MPPSKGETITGALTNNTYTMGGLIGEGSFGSVYECTDVSDNELAAKVLKPNRTYEQAKASATAEMQKLFLLRHPYITYVFDAFEFRDTFYIITERCVLPLSDFFGQEWFQGTAWLRPIARCLLQAVQFVHNNGFVHQDIHAGNVLEAFIRDEMVPADMAIQFKLADLGIAKILAEVDANNTRAHWMLPPEVLRADFGPLDHRIDIYHCGLLLLQVARTQELRFTPDEIKAGKPRQMALELEAPLNFALEKALRRHVQFRSASAMELWRDLNSPGPAMEPVEQPVLPFIEQQTTDSSEMASDKHEPQ